MTIGENIKKIRIEQGLTQKELGERIGIAPPNLRKYESDLLNPKIETIEKIAKGLGVSTSYLLGETNSKKIQIQKNMTGEERGELFVELVNISEMLTNQISKLQEELDLLDKFARNKQLQIENMRSSQQRIVELIDEIDFSD